MPDEGPKERVDRELIELLNELRVALPGVQVLFAFLLILPFSQRFREVTSAQRGVYFGAFVCTAVATALFIAPSSYHRLQFRQKDKERMLLSANKMAIAGTGLPCPGHPRRGVPDHRLPLPRPLGGRRDGAGRRVVLVVLVRPATRATGLQPGCSEAWG